MTQAGNNLFKSAFSGVRAHGADDSRAHKAPTGPGAKAAEVGSAFDRVQAVVADLKPQCGEVLAYAGQPGKTGGAVRGQHDAVVHVSAIVRHFQRAFAVVVKAVEVEVGKCLAHQVADRHPCCIGTLRECSHDRQRGLAFDNPLQHCLQHIAVDAVKKLSHVDMQYPVGARCAAHGCLQPVGSHVGAFASAAGEVGVDVAGFEKWQSNCVHGMLHHQVSERRGLDQSRLAAIVHHEAATGTWLVGLGL